MTDKKRIKISTLVKIIKKVGLWKWLSVGLVILLVALQLTEVNVKTLASSQWSQWQQEKLVESVLPSEGVVLPISWGSLGNKMIAAGVIDGQEFEYLYQRRGGLSDEMKALLYGVDNGDIRMTQENSNTLLNLLWAFGLSNKNQILEEGPMVDERYGGDAGKFASTGGWSLSIGPAMDHYSMHQFMALTPRQQELVERVSKNIYRPCCGNSVHFPDCNHGMAMLGLLELMAAKGATEEEMYNVALQVNAFWFPDTYLNIARYASEVQGLAWEKVNAKEILGSAYSSAAGYQGILTEIIPIQKNVGGSCGV